MLKFSLVTLPLSSSAFVYKKNINIITYVKNQFVFPGFIDATENRIPLIDLNISNALGEREIVIINAVFVALFLTVALF